MTFVADESIDQPIVDRLREDGQFIYAVAEMDPGIADEVVPALARQKQAPLLTADKDFGELVHRKKRLHSGVVLLRLAGLSAVQKAAATSSAAERHGTELRGAITVVSPQNIRIRRQDPGDVER